MADLTDPELTRLRIVFRLRDRRFLPSVARLRREDRARGATFPPSDDADIAGVCGLSGLMPGGLWVACGGPAREGLGELCRRDLAAMRRPGLAELSPKRYPGLRGAVVYLHGGGYLCGSPATHRDLAARLSAACGVPVLLPTYRLAPEHPFPAALDDAAVAVNGLLAALAPLPVVVGGDSAGGGLAVAVSLALREQVQPLPAALFALSPWTDLTGSGETMVSHAARDLVLTPRGVRAMARLVLAGVPADHPLASPLWADLCGLPALRVQVGSEEILLDDARRLVARAQACGVAAQLEVWEGLMHNWQFYARILSFGDQALGALGRWIAEQVSKH